MTRIHLSRRALTIWLTMAVLTTSCQLWSTQRDGDKVGRLDRAADRIYAKRSDPQQLDLAIQAYLDVLAIAPDDRRVLARLTRAYLARGYGFADDPRGDLALAREYGMRCLMTDAGFAARVQNSAGRVSNQAIQAIDREHGVCLVWTTIAWSRWLTSTGPGAAALDLDLVASMARHGVELVPDYDAGRALEALGLALSLPPTPLGPDLDGAVHALDDAIALSPARLSLSVDRAVVAWARDRSVDAWRSALDRVVQAELRDDDRDRLENQRAIERAQAYLQEGTPPADPWQRFRPEDQTPQP